MGQDESGVKLTENVGSGIEQNHKVGRTRKNRSALSLADSVRQTYSPARGYSRDPPFYFSTFSPREFSCDGATRTANDDVARSTRGRDKAAATNSTLEDDNDNDDDDDDDDDESNGDDCSFFFMMTNDIEPSVFLFLSLCRIEGSEIRRYASK